MYKLNSLFYLIRPNCSLILGSRHYRKMLAIRQNKRGGMLSKLIENKDTNKKWHLNFMETAPRAKSVFEGIHRPNKRQNVLNSLFVKNITDVLSTGDVAPELMGHGIEINGVKTHPCFKMLTVYWQVPPNSYDKHEEIAIALNSCAPRLRAELISRNLMGRVPNIFFVRDIANAKMAYFENALKDADLGPENERSVIPDDSFTKDVLVFRVNKKVKEGATEVKAEVKSVQVVEKSPPPIPQRPAKMKSDVFGLKYDDIFNKVISSRGKIKYPENSAVISSEFFPSSELFDKIPGTTLQPAIDRSQLLKQFQVERKIERKKKRVNLKLTSADSLLEEDNYQDVNEMQPFDYNDYVEEETSDSSFR